jgi:hypothetical protein
MGDGLYHFAICIHEKELNSFFIEYGVVIDGDRDHAVESTSISLNSKSGNFLRAFDQYAPTLSLPRSVPLGSFMILTIKGVIISKSSL